MNILEEPLKNFLSQKGQGMLEYALMLSFVAAMYIVVFAEGGIGGSIMGVFDNACELLASASFDNDIISSAGAGASGSGSGSSSIFNLSNSENSSSSSTTPHTLQEIASENYKPLDWHEVIRDMKFTYDTITRTRAANLAVASEYNLFRTVGAMVSGTKEYHYADEQNLKGWNELVAQMGGQIESNKFTTSYINISTKETLDISRDGNKITLKYYDGQNSTKTFSIYATTDNNKMHFESDTSKELSTVLSEYDSFKTNILNMDSNWQFNQ